MNNDLIEKSSGPTLHVISLDTYEYDGNNNLTAFADSSLSVSRPLENDCYDGHSESWSSTVGEVDKMQSFSNRNNDGIIANQSNCRIDCLVPGDIEGDKVTDVVNLSHLVEETSSTTSHLYADLGISTSNHSLSKNESSSLTGEGNVRYCIPKEREIAEKFVGGILVLEPNALENNSQMARNLANVDYTLSEQKKYNDKMGCALTDTTELPICTSDICPQQSHANETNVQSYNASSLNCIIPLINVDIKSADHFTQTIMDKNDPVEPGKPILNVDNLQNDLGLEVENFSLPNHETISLNKKDTLECLAMSHVIVNADDINSTQERKAILDLHYITVPRDMSELQMDSTPLHCNPEKMCKGQLDGMSLSMHNGSSNELDCPSSISKCVPNSDTVEAHDLVLTQHMSDEMAYDSTEFSNSNGLILIHDSLNKHKDIVTTETCLSVPIETFSSNMNDIHRSSSNEFPHQNEKINEGEPQDVIRFSSTSYNVDDANYIISLPTDTIEAEVTRSLCEVSQEVNYPCEENPKLTDLIDDTSKLRNDCSSSSSDEENSSSTVDDSLDHSISHADTNTNSGTQSLGNVQLRGMSRLMSFRKSFVISEEFEVNGMLF
jgi:hypothetical protein